MANQEHLDLLKQGIRQWNWWRKRYPEIYPNLSGAYLSCTCLHDVDLSHADLSEANLNNSDLRHTDLRGAYLSGAHLHNADLSGADLSGIDLSHADLSRAYLNSADLIRVYLIHADLSRVHLRNADLSYANLQGSDLSRAHLRNADLSYANLQGSDLSHADLSLANLSGSNLTNADLHNADLYSAHLIGANLSLANLSDTHLTDVRMNMAKINHTTFAHLDLSNVRGLVELQYLGPSSIELYTIQLPKDGSALHFLRGAGVPDEWIDDYRIRMMSPIQYHSCFISYSSKDDMLARRLHADLQDHGVRCWFAPVDMKIGDKIRVRIDEAIHLHEKLLLLLSEHALASVWVEDEVEAALEKEQRQQREVLFPVRLDEHVMQASAAWAAKLRRTRHIGDFTHWTDPQEYQRAFERLLRDLKTQP